MEIIVLISYIIINGVEFPAKKDSLTYNSVQRCLYERDLRRELFNKNNSSNTKINFVCQSPSGKIFEWVDVTENNKSPDF